MTGNKDINSTTKFIFSLNDEEIEINNESDTYESVKAKKAERARKLAERAKKREKRKAERERRFAERRNKRKERKSRKLY
ncbi:MAG: hypothetical protein ACTSV2_01460 [Candidatus Thorarchaeota archaeon]